MRRIPHWLVALLLALPACAGAENEPPDADSGPLDGGPIDFRDAAPGDGGVVPPPPPEFAEYDSAIAARAATDACFDGLDNNDDGLFDCADVSCQENVGACCVGTSSTACCADGTAAGLPIATCASDLGSCVDGGEVAVFGSPAPSVRDMALLPGGQASDSGALLLRVLDPRLGAIRIEAQIASPATAPTSGRTETVGVGFVDATVDAGSLSRVTPIAGLIVSRNRNEVLLLVAGEVVSTWELETESAIDYMLEIDPAGVVRLTASPTDDSGSFESAVAYLASRPVRAVVYGRTANPTAAEPSTRVLQLSVTPRVCDMPAALGRSSQTVVPAPLEDDPSWAVGHDAIERPNVLRYEDPPGTPNVRMALMADGEVHLAAPGMGGFVLTTPIGEPALVPPTDAWATDGVDHPVLTWQEGELGLWFTGLAGERGTIATAHWDDSVSSFVSDGPVDGLIANATTGYADAIPFDLDGIPHAIVRADEADVQRLELWSLASGTATRVSALRQAPQTDLFAFDRDEIGGAAVVVLGGVTRVYYAGRRGTRWSIGVLASNFGDHWAEPPNNLVLGPSDVGFDAIGARDPATDVVDGVIHLYYAGDDGRRTRIGRAIGATR